MDRLGMFALGGFVGGLLCLGLPVTTEISGGEFQKIAFFVLTSAFTGPVFVWIGYLGGSKIGEALFAYPIGILIALLWFYVRLSLINIAGDNLNLQVLGGLHIIAIVLVTAVALYIFVLPVVRPPKT